MSGFGEEDDDEDDPGFELDGAVKGNTRSVSRGMGYPILQEGQYRAKESASFDALEEEERLCPAPAPAAAAAAPPLPLPPR
jgi:hypothetical protein